MHWPLTINALFVVLLLGGAQSPSDAASEAAPGTSPPLQVQKVERIIKELQDADRNGLSAPATHTLTESELNAYLRYHLARERREDIKSVQVNLREDSFLTTLVVDLDHVQMQGDTSALALLGSLLSSTQKLEVEGTLKTADGRARYEVLSAHLNGIPVPASVVNSLLSSAGRKQHPPFDPTQPFDLPWNIKRLEVRPGLVTIFS